MIKYLLLDVDGTLVNTLPLTTKAAREFVVGFKGIFANITEKTVIKVMSLPGPELLQHFLGDVPLDIDEYHDVYVPAVDALSNKAKLFPLVKETLDELKANGIKLFILSNKDDGTARRYLESLFGKNYFDGIQGKIPGVPAKPAPYMAQALFKKYHLFPKDGLVVGDSEFDVQTALNVNMKCAIVNYGYGDAEIMNTLPDPDYEIDDFHELVKIVEDSKPKQRHMY